MLDYKEILTEALLVPKDSWVHLRGNKIVNTLENFEVFLRFYNIICGYDIEGRKEVVFFNGELISIKNEMDMLLIKSLLKLNRFPVGLLKRYIMYFCHVRPNKNS